MYVSDELTHPGSGQEPTLLPIPGLFRWKGTERSSGPARRVWKLRPLPAKGFPCADTNTLHAVETTTKPNTWTLDRVNEPLRPGPSDSLRGRPKCTQANSEKLQAGEMGTSRRSHFYIEPPLPFFWAGKGEVLLTGRAGKCEPRQHFRQGRLLNGGHLGSAPVLGK